MSINSKKVQVVFDKIKENNQDILDIVLTSYDGLSMVSTINSETKDEAMSVMSAEFRTIFEKYRKVIGWKNFSNMSIQGNNGYIIMKHINDLGILVIITNKTSDIKTIKSNISYITNSLLSAGIEDE